MKILTALNNNEIYKRLKKELGRRENFNIFDRDIVYKEGIIEFLINNKDTDIILLNADIEGDIDIFTLIKKVVEIKKEVDIIILISEDDLSLRKFLSSYNISKILIEDESTFDDLLNLIIDEKRIKEKSIEREIEELRNLIFEKEKNSFKNKIMNRFKKDKQEKKTESLNKIKKIKNNIRDKIFKNKTRIQKNKRNKNKDKNKNQTKKNLDSRIYFSLSEDLQKYNIDSIDITINIKK